MRRNQLVPTDEEQAELFVKPLAPDVFTLLRLFENYRGIDVPQSWDDLKQVYHSVYDDPRENKSARSSWGSARLNKTLDSAEALGLIEYQDKWEITAKGLEVRKAETVRRMRA